MEITTDRNDPKLTEVEAHIKFMKSILDKLIEKYTNTLSNSKNMYKNKYGALEYSYAGNIIFIFHPKSAEIFYSFDNFYKQFITLGYDRKLVNARLTKAIFDKYKLLVKIGNTMCK